MCDNILLFVAMNRYLGVQDAEKCIFLHFSTYNLCIVNLIIFAVYMNLKVVHLALS
jgi:hypothetical protein